MCTRGLDYPAMALLAMWGEMTESKREIDKYSFKYLSVVHGVYQKTKKREPATSRVHMARIPR